MALKNIQPATNRTASTKPVLNLVKAYGEYFPFKEADYALLRDQGIPLCRISQSVLDLLQATHPLFKRLTLNVQKWGHLYPSLRDSFFAALPSEIMHRGEADWVMIQLPDSSNADQGSTPEEQALALQVDNAIKALENYMGCYGFQVMRDKRDRRESHGYLLLRLTFVPSPDVIPSFHLGKDPLKPESQLELTLTPSENFRIRLSRAVQPNGTPAFKVVMTDVFPHEERDLVARAFALKNLTPGQCKEAINFFTMVYGSLTSESKKK